MKPEKYFNEIDFKVISAPKAQKHFNIPLPLVARSYLIVAILSQTRVYLLSHSSFKNQTKKKNYIYIATYRISLYSILP